MKPQYWSEWKAFAWEDCEVGMGTISARTPEGERFTWTVRFSHDGDPSLEFWGAAFDILTLNTGAELGASLPSNAPWNADHYSDHVVDPPASSWNSGSRRGMQMAPRPT